MSKITVLNHPLIQHKLTMLRDKETGPKDFRDLTNEIAMLMCYEVTREVPMDKIEIETPLEKTEGYVLSGKDFALVPILRAGLGMVEGMLSVIPTAKVGHIGLYRDPETLQAVEYYCKLPSDIGDREIFVLDPMLATGVSSVKAIDLVKERGGKKIKMLNIVSCQEGLDAVQEAHPDVDIFVATIDRELNDHAYILPGLGDAGDRLFGTK